MAGNAQRRGAAKNAVAIAKKGGYVEGLGRDSKTKQLVATSRGGQIKLSQMTGSQRRTVLNNINSGMKRRYR